MLGIPIELYVAGSVAEASRAGNAVLRALPYLPFHTSSCRQACKRTVQSCYLAFLASIGMDHANLLAQPGTLAFAIVGLVALPSSNRSAPREVSERALFTSLVA